MKSAMFVEILTLGERTIATGEIANPWADTSVRENVSVEAVVGVELFAAVVVIAEVLVDQLAGIVEVLMALEIAKAFECFGALSAGKTFDICVHALMVSVESSAAESLRALVALKLSLHLMPRSDVILQRMFRRFRFTAERTQEANHFQMFHHHVLFKSRLSAFAVTAVVACVGILIPFQMAEKLVTVWEDFLAPENY